VPNATFKARLMLTDLAELKDAIARYDLGALERLAKAGADLNQCDSYGTPLLHDAVMYHLGPCSPEDQAKAHQLIAKLIDLGANPNQLEYDGGNILICPIFAMDEAMVALLLAHGVDPNRGCSEPFESVYDAAVFDYYYEAWLQLPGPELAAPSPADKGGEDAWLRFLGREAAAKGRPAPKICQLLREHGALSKDEIAAKLSPAQGERVEWRDVEWKAVRFERPQ